MLIVWLIYSTPISIHALLAESDHYPAQCPASRFYFYPRSPCGERRLRFLQPRKAINFYPRSPCGERRAVLGVALACWIFLSTLSLRRATQWALLLQHPAIFLSTLSLRRATLYKCNDFLHFADFYPRSPCGERQSLGGSARRVKIISIHALLAESDNDRSRRFIPGFKFLSTLSLRRATAAVCRNGVDFGISIHALLAESDSKSAQNSGALLRI